jgi:hypothetical protein
MCSCSGVAERMRESCAKPPMLVARRAVDNLTFRYSGGRSYPCPCLEGDGRYLVDAFACSCLLGQLRLLPAVCRRAFTPEMGIPSTAPPAAFQAPSSALRPITPKTVCRISYAIENRACYKLLSSSALSLPTRRGLALGAQTRTTVTQWDFHADRPQ